MLEKSAEEKRLRWSCSHRAMLEMDVLLGNFLERKYAKLNPEQAAAFVALVDMQDIDLWPLVAGRSPCQNAVQAEVIEMLRDISVKK